LHGDSLNKDQFGDAMVTFVATPLIVIIAVYLLACAIASTINLNTQPFRILVTAAGGAPIIFAIYQKNKKINKKTERTKTTQHD
jgi:hypothetical protein